MFHLAYFVSHPIQYQAPLLRLIADDPDISLKVFFYSDFSVREYRDPGFGRSIQWDVPLTEGYDHQFLRCWGSKQYESVLRQPVARDSLELLRDGKFDAVWIHGWSWLCSLQTILAANQLGLPVLMRGESNGLTEPSHLIKRVIKNIFLKWLFQKIDAFLYIGTLNRKFYERHGIKSQRLFHFPYAVDNAYFQQLSLKARLHRKELCYSLQLEPGRPIILYAAKLIEQKRPQDLLAAYRLLSPDRIQEPEPYLLFVGDGVLRVGLESEAKATGWDSIRFLGFRNQSEIPAFYDLCDVFVLPSGFEPWGLAINEVMNATKAIVVSDRVGCAPDLVQNGVNGRIYPDGDVSALAEAMKWAIAHSTQAGQHSLQRINTWSFAEDLQGIKQALSDLRTKAG